MKKKITCLFLIICLMCPWVLSSCEKKHSNRTRQDAEELAKSQFGVQKILAVGSGTTNNALCDELDIKSKSAYYVMGKIAEEEKFILVPYRFDETAFEIEWLFDFSFEQTMTALNEYIGYDVYEQVYSKFLANKDKIGYFVFELNEYIIYDRLKAILNPKAENVIIDCGLMVILEEKYFIVQSNGELAFFTL